MDGRSFQVKIGNTFSSSRNINSGVPQGGVLSPTLFNIFVSDMPTCDDADLAQFADDTLLLAPSYRTNAIINKLSKFGSRFSNYFSRWHIKINSDKSETCFFHKAVGSTTSTTNEC